MIHKQLFLYFFTALCIFGLLFWRNPHRLLQPQLWAEDGAIFFKDAYELNFFDNLIKPSFGYLQITQRAVAGMTVEAGLYSATPLIWNLFSTVVAALIIALFVTKLYQPLIGNLTLRFVLCLVIAAGGAHDEILSNLANLHSYFSIIGIHLCVLLWFFPKFKLPNWLAIPTTLLLFLITISNPYSFLFVPFVAIFCFRNRLSSTNWWLIVSFFIGTIYQMVSYFIYEFLLPNVATRPDFTSTVFTFSHANTNPKTHLSIITFITVFARRVLVQNLIPVPIAQTLSTHHLGIIAWIVATLIAIGYFAYSRKKGFALFLFEVAVFSVMQLLLARTTVLVDIANVPQYDTYFAGRYFFTPYVIFLLLGFAVLSQTKFKNVFITTSLILQIFASLFFFKNRIFLQNFFWQKYADQIPNLPKNQKLIIPINPPGWKFDIEGK